MQAGQYKPPRATGPSSGATAGSEKRLRRRLTGLVVVLVPLMIALGFWQLSRAEEKAALAAQFADRQSRTPASQEALAGLDAAELAYLPVELTGRFDSERYFLLDNRTRQGRFGNEVIALFRTSGDEAAFLVNRGWVPADPARRARPGVPRVAGEVTLRGTVYVPPGEALVLGDQAQQRGWPRQVQSVDVPRLGGALGLAPGELFPYLVRLDADSPGSLQVGWPVVNVSPEKHTGYAVQWFSMAGVLALIYLWRMRRGSPGDPPGREES